MPTTPPFEPYSAAFTADPYAVYARLRHESPLYHHAPWDAWLLFCDEDIRTLLTDARLGRVMDAVMSPAQLHAWRREQGWDAAPMHSRYVKTSIIDSEGELHDRLRKAVFRVFTPRAVAQLEPYVQTVVSRQIDAVSAQGGMDFIADCVAPVPGLVIGALLGVPEADCAQLRRWSEDIVQFFEPERSPAHRALAESATIAFADYLETLIDERRRRPGEDLVSAMLAWQDNDGRPLSHDELVSTCMTVLMAGHGSTIDAAGNGLLALLQHPDQLALLKRSPALAAGAVQEMFRFDPPLPYFHRHVLAPLQIRGQPFERGATLGFCYASANRDPARFPDPDRFDIRRTPNRHLAFGGGIHHCLGNHLARMNMICLFNTLLARLPGLRLADPDAAPAYRRSFTSRGLERLDLHWG